VTAWLLLGWLAVSASGPEELHLPGFRLHLQLTDEVESDRLEALARPDVVLWLETRTNLMKRSVAERLSRAGASYVQTRMPLMDGVRQQFVGVVHPWVALEGLDVDAYRRWAPGGTAVEVSGTLSEQRLRSLQSLHALSVRWEPAGTPTAEEWARASHVAGLEVHPSEALPACDKPLKGAARIRLRLSPQQAETSALGCGFALRLEVPVTIDAAELRVALARFPGADLWARVGGDAEAAAAGALVGRLRSATPAAPSVSPR
jgi:hypothetical protein